MLKLLGIEWSKIIYNRGTRLLLVLYFVMITGMVLLIPSIKPSVGEESIDLIRLGMFSPEVIWSNIAYIMSFGKFLLGIIIINSVTNEYSYGTYRQNIIDGWSKKDFFQSKLLMGIAITLLTTLLIGVTIVVLGLYYNGAEDLLYSSVFLLSLFFEYLGYMVLALFVSFLFRRSSYAILALFVFPFGELILRGLAHFLFLPEMIGKTGFRITDFTPFRANGLVNTFFNIDLMQYMTLGTAFNEKEMNWFAILATVFYAVLLGYFSYWLLKRRDVK